MNKDDTELALRVEQPDGISGDAERKFRIIVADDEALVRDVIAEYLLDAGYDVTMVESGEEALKYCSEEKFDIALVDFKMAGIDGLTTIEKLTEISPSTVSVLMTGFPTLDSSIRALRLGVSDYILKPFKLHDISASIERAIEEWRMKDEMNRLGDRMVELKDKVRGKMDSIKINRKIDTAPRRHSHPSRQAESRDPGSRRR